MNYKTLILCFICCSIGSGCTYLSDRGRDLSDVITLTAEDQTLSCAAQIVILPIGFSIAEGKGFGLRDGYAGSYEYIEKWVILPYAEAVSDISFNPTNDKRNKGYYYSDEDMQYRRFSLGANLGVIYGFRAAVNLSETLDFVLGLGTIDIMNDDLSSMLRQKENIDANHQVEPIVKTSVDEVEAQGTQAHP